MRVRVTRPQEPRDAGIATVYVAITLFMIMAAGAVAVDAGMMWDQRRDLVADVDSATMAAAQVHKSLTCDSGTTNWTAIPSSHLAHVAAVNMLARNQGAAPDPADYLVERSCTSDAKGKVRVTYVGEVEPFFATVLGFDELNVQNSTIAQFQPIGGGLRPIGVCGDDGDNIVNTEYERWLAGDGPRAGDDTTTPWMDEEDVLTFSWGKSWNEMGVSGGCGTGGSGSWGLVCFDKSENTCNANTTGDLLLDGWPYDVDLGNAPPNSPPPVGLGDPQPEPRNGWSDYDCKIGSAGDNGPHNTCDTDTGSGGSTHVMDAVKTINCDWNENTNTLIPSGQRLPAEQCPHQFPILGIYELVGSGSNAVFRPYLFIGVVMRHPSFLGTGNNRTDCDQFGYYTGSWGNEKHCLTFELTGVFNSGTLADNNLLDKVTRLCGVEGDSAGDRCDF